MKLCPTCRKVSETSPCAACRRKADKARGSRAERGYGPAWAALSRRARREHPWCAKCGATSDLTTDHVVPLKVTGTAVRPTMADVVVLCRPCNSSKGARVEPTPPPSRGRRAPGGPDTSSEMEPLIHSLDPAPDESDEAPSW